MEAHWQETTRSASQPATHRRREAQIADWTSRQLSLITTRQLTDAGLSPSGVRSRLARGRLHRLRREVYATHAPPFSREQHWLAATLACGFGSLISHAHAAAAQDMCETPPLTAIDVTLPSGRGRSRQGISVHRSPVDPRDVRRVDGVPCTSPDRVLVDLAPHVSEPDLEQMLVAAESRGTLKRGRLAELVGERRGRPGIARLESLLAIEPQLTASELELLFRPLWRAAGLPRPRTSFPVRVPDRVKPFLVDVAWPELRLAVELDSQRFHGDWESAERDRERDQLLALAGWVCHRFVRRVIAEDRAASARRLRRLYGLRAATRSAARR